MSIVIFKDLTTDEHVENLEAEAKKYKDLWVDMNDENERRFVKESASVIKNTLKIIDRGRIDKKKAYSAGVEAEAKRISDRLTKANSVFTKLIDDHTAARAVILAKKKAKEEAEALAIQIEQDHEDAITLDKIRTFEIEEAKRRQKERDEQIAKEAREEAEREKVLAEERAEQAEKDRILAEAKAKRDAEEAEKRAKAAAEQAEKNRIEAEKLAEERRLQAIEDAKQAEIKRQEDEKLAKEEEQRRLEANKKHVGAVRGEIKDHLISSCKIDEPLAKKIVLALLKTERVTINY